MIHTFPDIKVLFIKVPATGGGSFWLAMKSKNRFHDYPVTDTVLNMQDIRNKNLLTAAQARATVSEEIWNTYEKIGLVRHPVKWINSLYYKPLGGNHYGIDESNNGMGRVSFYEFVKNRINKTPYDWFTDDEGNVIIDSIYRTEDLDDIVFPKYGLEQLHFNPRQKSNKFIDVVPNDEEMEIIRNKFHRELRHYPDFD